MPCLHRVRAMRYSAPCTWQQCQLVRLRSVGKVGAAEQGVQSCPAFATAVRALEFHPRDSRSSGKRVVKDIRTAHMTNTCSLLLVLSSLRN